jgi:hypothetical protein
LKLLMWWVFVFDFDDFLSKMQIVEHLVIILAQELFNALIYLALPPLQMTRKWKKHITFESQFCTNTCWESIPTTVTYDYAINLVCNTPPSVHYMLGVCIIRHKICFRATSRCVMCDAHLCRASWKKEADHNFVWMKIQGLFDNYNKDDKGQCRGLVTKSNLYSIRLWVEIVQWFIF